MQLHLGDSLEVLKTLPANSVDSVVTDPPYGWRFMGKAWDAPDIKKHADWAGDREGNASAAGKYSQTLKANRSFQEWTEAWAVECFRVLKPGGYMLVFCGPRTYHRMAAGVEDAGFEIRDQLQWIFGSGFPKSHNLKDDWQGFGTALKPANEPIVLARKPLAAKTVAKNVLRFGTGALNIDQTRIAYQGDYRSPARVDGKVNSGGGFGAGVTAGKLDNAAREALGRWPANVIFDEHAAAELDRQSGQRKAGGSIKSPTSSTRFKNTHSQNGAQPEWEGFGDSGGASRFFYIAKPSKRERNAGLEGMPKAMPRGLEVGDNAVGSGRGSKSTPRENVHPTVKPVKLMEYLITLVNPPGGVVLDPFLGSGTTLVAAAKLGVKGIGIEREAEYLEIAKRRIAHFEIETEMPSDDDDQMEFDTGA